MSARVHPELAIQLNQPGGSPLQAVVELGTSQQSPEVTSRLAKEVLQRVSEIVGHSAERTNILRNLARVVVEADRDFLRSLREQPEVLSAMPNQMTESPFIPPVRKHAV